MNTHAASPGHVLIVVQNLPVPFDRRVWLEANTLRDAGYTVSVISPTGQHGKFSQKQEIIDDIHIFRYPAPPEAHGAMGYLLEFAYCWLMTAWLSIGVALGRGFDILHACNPPETYFLLAAIYKLFGKKFLFDHHDLSPEMYVAKGGKEGGFLHRGLLWLERQTFRLADVVTTTNESHKEIAIARGHVAPENVYIVRSGPDFDRLQVLPPEPQLKDGRQFLVCYLGEMCEQDGVDLLLQVARILIVDAGHTNIKFVFMGGGPELEKLKQLRSDLGLEGAVDFTGRVSDHDLCRYLSTADVCIDPDPFTEWSNQSTMNKIMEYMTFAKPIVAFDLRENRFSAQEAALYATPNDVYEMAQLTLQLLYDEAQRRAMGAFGQQRVHSSLAWEYSKPPLLDAYAAALRSGSHTITAHPPAS